MTSARPISLVLAAGLTVLLSACASPGSATPSASAGAVPAAEVTPAASQPVAGMPGPAASAPAGDNSPMYKGGPGRTGEMPGVAITSQPVTLWTVALGGPAISSPAVVDGVAFVSAGNHRVLAVAADTGKIAWEATTTNPVRSSPAVAGGLVFVNDEGGALTAYDTVTGKVRWTADAGVASESMPLVLDGAVYIGTQHGDLIALDAATGTRRWAFPTGGELTHSPSSDGTRVFIGSADGTLYGVDLATGEVAWKFEGGAARWTTAAVRDGIVFTVGHEVAGGGDALFAIDASTGSERWRAPSAGGLSAPSAGAGTAYVADESGTLRAFEAATGKERWSADVGGYMRPSPAVVGSALYVFGGSNEALGIDSATGQILWRVPIDGTVEYGTTAAGGRMFAVTTAGTLYAIGPEALADATSAPPSATPSEGPSVNAALTTALAGAPGGLSVPTGLDVDPKGRIWVAEGGKNDFVIYGPDGAYLERWGTSGPGPGQFDFNNANSGNPTADIAFAPDGGFYVADTGNFRIQLFDAKRTFVRAWGGFGKGNGQFAIPYALDLDALGNVYVTSGNGNVQAFTPDGAYVRTIGEPGSGDGQLANAGLAVSGDRLLVADFDNHRVAVFGLDGTFIANWATREIGDPNAIDASPDGTVYVTSSVIGGTSDGLVHVLDRTGTIIGSFKTESDPGFVTALGNGLVAVTGEPSGIYEVGLP